MTKRKRLQVAAVLIQSVEEEIRDGAASQSVGWLADVTLASKLSYSARTLAEVAAELPLAHDDYNEAIDGVKELV